MRTTKVLSVTLPEAMLKEAKKRAKKENRTMSELVREALRRYESLESLRELQAYGERRARELGITQEDVDRLIHEDRAEKRQRPKGEALERKAS
jgi:CopG family transcriptional regulator / antitoxin EndoAI